MIVFGCDIKNERLQRSRIFAIHVGCLLLSLFVLCVGTVQAQAPLRVLMIFDEGPELIALELIEEGFETTLLAGTTQPVEFFHEYLDASRFRKAEHHNLFTEYLQSKYGKMKLDLVIPIVGTGKDWASRIPREMFPEVPIVFGSVLSDGAESIPLVPNMTGVQLGVDVVKGVETALAIKPRTRRVIVVAGPEGMHSDLIALIEVTARNHPKVGFDYWVDQTESQILESAASLPNNTLVFYIELFRDSAGASFIPWQFGQALAKAASVPVFGIYESYVGTGILGGAVVSFSALGTETGKLALRVLDGERASAVPMTNNVSAIPMFDWRAMQRWGITDADLPDASIVRFRPPPLWETHRSLLIAGTVWTIALTIVLLALILQRALRRQAEIDLKQNEERLRLALDISGASAWEIGLKTGSFVINEKARSMFGFTPDEEVDLQQLLGKVHPDDRESLRAEIDKTSNSHQDGHIEHRIVTGDGSIRWIAARGRVHLGKNGDSDRLMGVSLDITESKANDEEIRQQKEFTDTLVNSLPGIYYLYDHKWRLIRWNRSHEILTGFTPEEMEKRPLLEWFSPSYKSLMSETIEKVFNEGEAAVEAPLLLKDGSQVPYLFKGVRLEITGELYFLGMGIDISQRKAKEHALRQSEQQLRLIADNLPALISYLGSDQSYLWVNETYKSWWGTQHDDIIGKPMREVLGEAYYAKIRQHIETVLTGKAVTFESEIIHPTLGSRDVLVNYVPDLVDKDVRGYFVLANDVTDHRKALMQAKQDRASLEHVSRVTTMSELATSLAHELNQPLTAILSNAQAGQRFLQQSEPDLKEIEEILTDIVADDKRASDVIQQMRAFLRKDMAPHELLDINNVIKDVLNILHSEVIIQGITIKTDLASDLPYVQADRVQLEQVFINLILNAQQAGDCVQTNSCVLTIKTAKDVEGPVIVSVQDTGPGIDEASLERIFEPFHTTKIGGMGMGLSISRTIVEANGGRIWAENAPEGGARLCVTLPTGDQT